MTLIVGLPARLLASLLPPRVTVGTLQGTIWSGRTDALAVDGQPVGAVRWQLHPLHLLLGRLGLAAELDRRDGQARADLRLGFGGSFEARDVEVHLPLATLPRNIVPGGWTGAVRAQLEHFSLPQGAVPRIDGTIELRNLKAPPPQGAAIGSYSVLFDATSRQKDRLVGKVKDIDGPMQVTGTLSLGADRSYVIEGMVAPRADASQTVTDTLRFLGAPDAQGRRPFSVAGTY
ncbi:MAG TPA: type II secretion system protein N [Steroidobacteraceae bacterium]|nr:type II secretion system protein N [Steroidobacteraceae bacterium]